MRPLSNPPNPYRSTHVEYLGEPPPAPLEVYEEQARSILSANDSPDIPLQYSVNPYRGCQHACAYCYARASHEFLDWGAGTDFDRRIIVKVNAPELLSVELTRTGVRGQTVGFSGNTDCYQPLEASYELTRRCLQVCLQRRTPVAVITKAPLVQRDADLLKDLTSGPGARVFLSIPSLDRQRTRAIEPGASAPAARFKAMRALSDAGVPSGIAVAPLIPSLNDTDIVEILERAADAGAKHAFMTLVHLHGAVRQVFEERLREELPERAEHVLSALEQTRSSQSATAFHERMRGAGPRWAILEQLFATTCRRLGLKYVAGVEYDVESDVGKAQQQEMF